MFFNLTSTPFPDCGAERVEDRRDHAVSGPLILWCEAVEASDRAWFDRHPSAQSYRRPPVVAETAFARWLLGPFFAGGRVLVCRDRTRSYAGIQFTPRN